MNEQAVVTAAGSPTRDRRARSELCSTALQTGRQAASGLLSSINHSHTQMDQLVSSPTRDESRMTLREG